MKLKRQHDSQLVRWSLCVILCVFGPTLSVAICQQTNKPITRDNLMRSFEPGRREKIAVKSYIDLITRNGVAFALTPEDEKRIRVAGKYLGKKGIEDLIAAIHKNYRPNNSEESSRAKAGEPTEAEMKQALLNTMQKRGGQLKADGCIQVDNPIAGVCGKIENFEKLEGCKPADQGAGYFCTYNVTVSLSLHSNEGTEAGLKHVQAVNTFWGWFGVTKGISETVTKRFVRGKEGWTVSNE